MAIIFAATIALTNIIHHLEEIYYIQKEDIMYK